jgi:intergrase/recombinase
MMNERVKEAAKKAGIGNNNGKYGRMRAYCLRKFFTTQLTNRGVEDKIVNFFTCHKISPVDLVYWSRRVEQLREIYKQRENT